MVTNGYFYRNDGNAEKRADAGLSNLFGFLKAGLTRGYIAGEVNVLLRCRAHGYTYKATLTCLPQ